MSEKHVKALGDFEMKALWDFYDQDKDGVVTLKEWTDLLNAIAKKDNLPGLAKPSPGGLPEEFVFWAFEEVDKEHAGDVKQITWQDFKEGFNQYWTRRFEMWGNYKKNDGKDSGELKKEIEKLLLRIKDLENQIENLKIKLSEEEAGKMRYLAEIENLKRLLGEKDFKIEELSSEVKRLKLTLHEKTTTVDPDLLQPHLNEITIKYEREFEILREDLESTKQELDFHKSNYQEMEAEVEKRVNEVASHQNYVVDMEAQFREEAEKKQNKWKTEKQNFLDKIQKLEDQEFDYAKRLRQMEQREQELIIEVKKTKLVQETPPHIIKRSQAEQARYRELDAEILKLKDEFEVLQAEIKEKRIENNALTHQNDLLKTHSKKLHEKVIFAIAEIRETLDKDRRSWVQNLNIERKNFAANFGKAVQRDSRLGCDLVGLTEEWIRHGTVEDAELIASKIEKVFSELLGRGCEMMAKKCSEVYMELQEIKEFKKKSVDSLHTIAHKLPKAKRKSPSLQRLASPRKLEKHLAPWKY